MTFKLELVLPCFTLCWSRNLFSHDVDKVHIKCKAQLIRGLSLTAVYNFPTMRSSHSNIS